MKKQLLVLAFAGITAGLSAQNFSIVDNSSANITGTTQTYYVPNNALDTRTFAVHNLTGSAATIKVRKTIITLADASESAYFCTDQNCYSPSQTLSLSVNMTSGGQFILTCDYDPASVNGVSSVRYAVIDQSNMDSVTVIFNYNASPTGINNQSIV